MRRWRIARAAFGLQTRAAARSALLACRQAAPPRARRPSIPHICQRPARTTDGVTVALLSRLYRRQVYFNGPNPGQGVMPAGFGDYAQLAPHLKIDKLLTRVGGCMCCVSCLAAFSHPRRAWMGAVDSLSCVVGVLWVLREEAGVRGTERARGC